MPETGAAILHLAPTDPPARRDYVGGFMVFLIVCLYGFIFGVAIYAIVRL